MKAQLPADGFTNIASISWYSSMKAGVLCSSFLALDISEPNKANTLALCINECEYTQGALTKKCSLAHVSVDKVLLNTLKA